MARCSLTLVVLLVLVALCCLSSFSEAKSIAAGRFALNGKTTADAGSNQLDWYAGSILSPFTRRPRGFFQEGVQT